jgi:hypothetical protein
MYTLHETWFIPWCIYILRYRGIYLEPMNVGHYIRWLTDEYMWQYIHQLTNECTAATSPVRSHATTALYAPATRRSALSRWARVADASLRPPPSPSSPNMPSLAANTFCDPCCLGLKLTCNLGLNFQLYLDCFGLNFELDLGCLGLKFEIKHKLRFELICI